MNRFFSKSTLSHFCVSLLSLFFFNLLFTQELMAQDFQFNPDVESKRFNAWENVSYTYNSNISGLTVSHDLWAEMELSPASWPSKYDFPVISNIIKVGIDHENGVVANTAYKYKIVLNVTGYTAPGTSVFNGIPESERTFVIENNNDTLVAYNDLNERKLSSKYHKMEIQIAAIYKFNYTTNQFETTSLGYSSVTKNFFIESTVSVIRYDKQNYNLFLSSAQDAANHELTVAWAHFLPSQTPNCNVLPGAADNFSPVKYELEWTYVDDYQYALATGISSYKNTASNYTINYDFRNNATRIQTYNKTYKIPIIYEHGSIVFRIRTIRPDPADLSKLVYSPWSLLADAGTITNNSFTIYQIGVPSLYCAAQCICLVNAFESEKFDWQYSINFAEEGKYKHVLNYFDGAGHNRQTQTKINSDNEYIIAADHIYDYEGRPAIQTLPIPVMSSNLKYKNNLSYRAGSSPLSPYKAADFDNGCETDANPIPAFDGLSLAGTYYSASNPDKAGMQKFVPDAQGYPFIQTIYSPDNTNKVLKQGGAGANFQINTGHITSNTYVRADQSELNKLFGTQAGRSEYYPKVITKDPNGQLSYSIFNQSGKVVATALLGSSPDNANNPIVPLDNIVTPAIQSVDVLANLSQSTGDNMRSANYAFFSDAPGASNTLTYNATIPPYYTGCTNGPDNYINIQGRYKTKIVDECGGLVAGSEVSADIGTNGFATGTSISPPQAQSTPAAGISGSNFSLNPSKYTLIKELYFSDNDIKSYANTFVDNNSGIGKCYDYEDNFVRRSVESTVVPCVKSNEPVSHCSLLKRKMMDEMYPGAKYGQYIGSLGPNQGTFVSGEPNSIFTMVNDIGEVFDPSVGTTSPCFYTKNCSYENGGGATNSNGNQIAITSEVIPCSSTFQSNPGVPYNSSGMSCMNSPVTCTDYKYRYQWCLTLPSIWYDDGTGAQFGPGGAASPDYIIANFNDAMAEALLPFHPEYCKMQFCDDSYPEYLSKVTTYQEAKILGVSTLSAIISQDPLLLAFNNNTGNELSKFDITGASGSTFTRTIDKIALENAYCGCGNMEVFAYCRNVEYANQIANLQFSETDTVVSNAFIRNLIGLYLSNRTIRMQKRMEGAPDCGPQCQQDLRIQTILPPAVVIDLFGSGSTLSSQPGMPSEYNDFVTQFNNSLNSNSGVPSAVTTNDNNNQAADCEAEVASFKEALKYWLGTSNAQAQTTLENNLRSLTGCSTNNALPPFQKLTPQGVQTTVLGNDMNEYWNPYLAAYNVFDNKQSKSKNRFVSKSSLFYGAGLQVFFKRADVRASFSIGTIRTFSLSPGNLFENALAATLGVATNATITIQTYAKTVTDPEMLSVFPATTGANSRNYRMMVLTAANGNFDTLYFCKRVGTSSNNEDVVLNPSSTFNSGLSILDDPNYVSSSENSVVGSKLIFAKLIGSTASGVASTDDYVIWSNKTPMLDWRDPESIDDCLNCVQIKNAVSQYFAEPATLGLTTFASHPNFKICLANYLNYKLGKKHTYTEYEALMKGCALSDFFPFKKTPGQFFFPGFANAADAAAKVNDLNTYLSNFTPDGSENISVDYFSYSLNGSILLWLDLNSVPYKRRGDVYQYMLYNHPNLMANANGFDADLFMEVLVPAENTAPVWSSILAAFPSATASAAVDVFLKNADGSYNIAYKKYRITGASQPVAVSEATIADVIHAVKIGVTGAIFLESREVMRSDDYYATDPANSSVKPKQNYLNYAYGFTTVSATANLSPSVLKGSTGVAPLIGQNLVSYNNQWCSGAQTDLNYGPAPTSSNPGWQRLTTILTGVQGLLGTNKLFPAADLVPATGNPQLKVIKMSNGTAWYRYFDANNKLYNVYLVPAVPMFSGAWQNGAPPAEGGQSGYSMVASASAVPGSDGELYRFKVDMQRTFPGVSTPHVVTCYGYTDFPIGESGVLSNVVLADGAKECVDTLPCERAITLTAIMQGKALYQQYIDAIKQTHILAMRQWFPEQTVDKLALKTLKQQYQYTLYNYDLAGNLTSTVPPMGVNLLTETINPTTGLSNIDVARNSSSSVLNIGSGYYPVDTKKSEYWYNSLNQLTKQSTPDGGQTKFYYDKSGKLAFSQNAKQYPQGKFSYTLYDDQDRIKETGVVYLPWQMFMTPGLGGPVVFNPSVQETPADIAYKAKDRTSAEIATIITGKPREDVVATFYDEPLLLLNTYTDAGLNLQENLRKRVSSILFIPQLGVNNSAASYYSYGTHFSYDALGNVKTLVQDNPYLDYMGQRFKRVDYDYDLLSGKVNMVSYNRGRADQLYQKYSYDADNRITKAQSSKDGLTWDWDAAYTYYKHGPLAQMSVGDLGVQSVQYAYTIQGWLKAINGDVLDVAADMGHDGTLSTQATSYFPQDVVAHALDYHPGDYVPIGTQQVQAAANANTLANIGNSNIKGLYNGNIARQTTAINSMDNLQRTYTYDQLNRIKAAEYDKVDNITKAVGDMANAFANTYQYDQDGNIKTLIRKNGAGTEIDHLNYNYEAIVGSTATSTVNNNKLLSVKDDVNGTEGLPNGQPTGNYQYDEIGNLISDVQGNIGEIKWNAYGKVTDIQMDGVNKRLHFDYDAMGNRVRKDVLTLAGSNYNRSSDVYVRDASGNILAVYKGVSQINNTYTIEYINDHLRAAHGGGWIDVSGLGLAPFLADQFISNGTFTSTLITQAQEEDMDWSLTQTNNFLLADYLTASPGLFTQAIQKELTADFNHYAFQSGSTFLYKALGYNNPEYVQQRKYMKPLMAELFRPKLADAPKSGFEESGEALDRVTNFIQAIKEKTPELYQTITASLPNYNSGDPSDVPQLANQLVEEGRDYYNGGGDGEYYTYIMDNLEQSWNVVEDMSDLIYYTIDPDQSMPVESRIINNNWIAAHPNAVTTFSSAIMAADADIKTQAVQALAENIANTEDPNNRWLDTKVSLPDKLNIIMQAVPTTALVAFLDRFGIASVNNAIRATGMTADGYANRVRDGVFHGTLNPSYDPPSVVTPDPTNIAADRLSLAEHHLYGSSRLGIKTYNDEQYRTVYVGAAAGSGSTGTIDPNNTLGEHIPWYSGGYASWIMKDKTDPFTGSTFNLLVTPWENSRTLGRKQYELSDHLGNVLATVLDKKTGYGNLSGLYKGFYANLSSVTDYYPFGMIMPDRNLSINIKRFGFSGIENDNEVYGTGNYLNFDARGYDSRILRFTSVDPDAQSYPYWSPYSYAANSPIGITDDGNGPVIKLIGSSMIKENGKTVIVMKIAVSIEVAVINRSSIKLQGQEGSLMAGKLNEKAVQGNFKGNISGVALEKLKAYGLKKSTSLGLKSYDGVEFRYEMELTQSFRFTSNEASISNNEQILIVVNSHVPDIDNDAVGRASYDYGAATIDFMFAAGGVLINSLNKNTPETNGGNHEVVHLLGVGDAYKFINKKLVKNSNNLMGNNNSMFNLTSDQIDEIANNAIFEYSTNVEQNIKKLKPYYNWLNRTLTPKYNMSIKERISETIDHHNANTSQ